MTIIIDSDDDDLVAKYGLPLEHFDFASISPNNKLKSSSAPATSQNLLIFDTALINSEATTQTVNQVEDLQAANFVELQEDANPNATLRAAGKTPPPVNVPEEPTVPRQSNCTQREMAVSPLETGKFAQSNDTNDEWNLSPIGGSDDVSRNSQLTPSPTQLAKSINAADQSHSTISEVQLSEDANENSQSTPLPGQSVNPDQAAHKSHSTIPAVHLAEPGTVIGQSESTPTGDELSTASGTVSRSKNASGLINDNDKTTNSRELRSKKRTSIAAVIPQHVDENANPADSNISNQKYVKKAIKTPNMKEKAVEDRKTKNQSGKKMTDEVEEDHMPAHGEIQQKVSLISTAADLCYQISQFFHRISHSGVRIT